MAVSIRAGEAGGRFLESCVLFAIAKSAYEKTQQLDLESDRSRGAMAEATTAVVFAAAAIESFVNEMIDSAEIMTATAPADSTAYTVEHAIVTILGALEKRNSPTLLKFACVPLVAKKEPWSKDQEPYQSVNTLFKVRNAIMHNRPSDLLVQNFSGARQFTPAKILKRLPPEILSDDDIECEMPWLARLGTRAAAKWACDMAVLASHAIVDVLPRSMTKNQLAIFEFESRV